MDIRETLAGLAGIFASQARTGNATADRYVNALGRLMSNAGRWAAVSSSGIICGTRMQRVADGSIRTCGAGAISACVACQQPTCFDHALISPANGDVLCHSCVATAQQMANAHAPGWQQQRERVGPPPSTPPSAKSQCTCEYPWAPSPSCAVHGQGSAPHAINERAQHLRTLGLKAGASWEDIHARFRRLSVKYHPDRVKTQRAKTAREAKMKTFSAAYHWLRENRGAAA